MIKLHYDNGMHEFDYEINYDSLKSALTSVIYDEYFSKKFEYKDLISPLKTLISDLDCYDELVEMFEDELKEYFYDEAWDAYNNCEESSYILDMDRAEQAREMNESRYNRF